MTLPLSLPGVFAAAIFGFVGSFGEVAVSLILGGTGYQLMGNRSRARWTCSTIRWRPRSPAVATGLMLALLVVWYQLFDVRLFLGKIVGRA